MFFTGLMAFVLAIGIRGVASLVAAPRGSITTAKREFCLMGAFCTMLLSTLCWWTHIYNEDMTHFSGILELLSRFLKIMWLKMTKDVCSFVAVVLAVVSCILT